MSGVVDFRTQLEDENGNLMGVTGNPLVTSGGGGGGGGALADVLLTDSNGALFVSRDDGTTITYFNLNTNSVYTPVGTISAPSSGGAGGSALADVLLSDDTGALFVSRDNGTTVTYFNLNTNAVYTPSGTISAAPVAVSNVVADELLDGMQTLLIRLLNATNSPRGYDVATGRNRMTTLVESGTITQVSLVPTVTTVGTVTTVTNMGGTQAQLLANGQNVSAWAATVRSRIT